MEHLLDQVVDSLPLIRIPKNLTSLGFVGILEKVKECFNISITVTLTDLYENDEISFDSLKSIIISPSDESYCSPATISENSVYLFKHTEGMNYTEISFVRANIPTIEKKWLDKNINHYL